MKRTLFYNGQIHTMKSEGDIASSMLVSGKRILEIGNSIKDNGYIKVDLMGKHVYPLLIDSHVHMLLTIAVMAMGFNICEIKKDGVYPNTIKGIEKRIRDFVKDKSKNKVIAMNNYILSAIDECRMPTKDELDLWGEGRPIVIYNIDGHSTALSSEMLKKLGIDPSTTNGILQGEENERVQGRITDIVGSEIGLKELAKGIASFENKCAEYGIGMIGALEGNGDSKDDKTTDLIIKFAKHFNVDVRLFLQYIDLDRVKKYESILKNKRIGGCGDWEMDGAVGSHSAAFSIPFKDTNEVAPCYFTQENIDSVVSECTKSGYQVISHAIGDKGIDRILNAFEKVPIKGYNRIEHCEFLTDKELERIAIKGNIAVSMQPGYAWIDKRYLKTYSKFLDDLSLCNLKLKSIKEKGVLICGSSDSPVQDMDPYLQMLGMVDFYRENESISNYDAFKAYTVNPAIVLKEEKDFGTLEKGKFANFFISEKDFFSISKKDIISFRPESTFYYGKKYEKKKGTVFELLLSLFKKRKAL